jgi:hypothetical protein
LNTRTHHSPSKTKKLLPKAKEMVGTKGAGDLRRGSRRPYYLLGLIRGRGVRHRRHPPAPRNVERKSRRAQVAPESQNSNGTPPKMQIEGRGTWRRARRRRARLGSSTWRRGPPASLPSAATRWAALGVDWRGGGPVLWRSVVHPWFYGY